METGKMSKKGRILINTGDGKGKTTAALGTVLRAIGNEQHVLVLQFIKSGAGYGELKALARLSDFVEVRSMGKGFIFHKQEQDEAKMAAHRQAAAEAWQMVKTEVASGKWDLIVLDEINYAISFGLLEVEEVVRLIQGKPEALGLILTGRNAKPELIALADTVTEMKMVKHAYQQGIKAERGIEF